MLYARFKDEAEFRDQFVKPLLTRMGFYGIAHLHGAREFGKDFVFSELTKFGFIRHFAAQVKHEEKIHQTQKGKITELIEQVRQAFSVPFKLPDSPRDRHVSAVYIFNSGEITDGAKEHLSQELIRERFGDNVHVFDGDRLDTLNRLTAYQREQETRPLLLGLRNQLFLNAKIWESTIADLPQFSEARGPLLAGIEGFLSAPIFPDHIPLNEVIVIWQKARIVDAVMTRHRNGFRGTPEVTENDTATVRRLCTELIHHAVAVSSGIDKCVELFKPL